MAGVRYPKIATAILARTDLDHDGVVSKGEYAELAFPDEPMARWDRDTDGSLDLGEIEDAFLHADPARLQVEGRRAVYEKYGYPFGVLPPEAEGDTAPEADTSQPQKKDRGRRKGRAR